MISMLNLISSFTCDINNSITNLNIALGAYSECLLSSKIITHLSYLNDTYINFNLNDSNIGNCDTLYPDNCNTHYPSCDIESATYSIQNILFFDKLNTPVSVNITCSDNAKYSFTDLGNHSKYQCNYSNQFCGGISTTQCTFSGTTICSRPTWTSVDTVNCNPDLKQHYVCPITLMNLNLAAGQMVRPEMVDDGGVSSLQSQLCTLDQLNAQNEIDQLVMCVNNNDYINFILTLKNTLLVLEPFMNADCNNAATLQQCEQEYVNSIFS